MRSEGRATEGRHGQTKQGKRNQHVFTGPGNNQSVKSVNNPAKENVSVYMKQMLLKTGRALGERRPLPSIDKESFKEIS